MRRALVLVCVLAVPAFAQDRRLDELEKKAEEQAREIERLRAERMAQELRDSGDAGPPAPPREETFRWGFADGFFVEGTLSGVHYLLRPHAYVQLDYRAFAHAQANAAFPSKGTAEDRFLVRRAVLGLQGSFGEFDFLFEVEAARGANGLLPLQNFFLEWRPLEEFQLRAGHFIPPFALADGLTSPQFYDLPEEPMIDQAMAIGFRPGAMVKGKIEEGLLGWFLAASDELDTNGTVTGDPIVTARLASQAGPFELGASGAWERRAGVQKSFAGVTPGQFQFFAPVSVSGWTERYELDLAFGLGPFFGSSEFAWALQERKRVLADGGDGTPLIVQGAYVTLGWMFAGPVKEGWELFSLDLVRKRNARHPGAELVLRFEWAELDDARDGRKGQGAVPAVPSTAPNADKIKGNDAKAAGIGVNFYPIANLKFMAEYIHVHVGDQSRAERAHSREADEFLFRAQLEF